MRRQRRLRAGLQLMEVLVASLIMAVSLAAIVSLFSFGFGITQQNDDKSVAYNIARIELEFIRSEGFSNALIVRDNLGVVTSKFQDGTRVSYYSAGGAALPDSTGAVYSATLVVTSDRFDTLNSGATRPSADSLRSVIVTVRNVITSRVVHTDGTMLARSGV